MVRILVTGDRRWACHDLADEVISRLLARYGPDFVIVHGAALGVDMAFDFAARAQDIATEQHEADWDAHGPKAGPIRNQEMVDAGADFCIAVHRDVANSRGTRDCVRRCQEAGIPVWLIDSEVVRPRRIKGEGNG